VFALMVAQNGFGRDRSRPRSSARSPPRLSMRSSPWIRVIRSSALAIGRRSWSIWSGPTTLVVT